MAPNSTLHHENLPELPSGFLHPHPFPNTPIIKDKEYRVSMQKYHYRFFIITLNSNMSIFFCNTQKTYPSKHTEVYEKEIWPHEMVK